MVNTLRTMAPTMILEPIKSLRMAHDQLDPSEELLDRLPEEVIRMEARIAGERHGKIFSGVGILLLRGQMGVLIPLSRV